MNLHKKIRTRRNNKNNEVKN